MSGNGGSISLNFDLGCGATYRGPANAWASANYLGATGAIRVVSTNGANFAVTGVKLEVGSVATPFNRQSLAKSMADCQRYYQKIGGVTLGDIIVQGYSIGAGQGVACTLVTPTMRAAPTVTAVGAWSLTNTGGLTFYSSPSSIGLQALGTAAGSVGAYTGGTSTYLTASAEL